MSSGVRVRHVQRFPRALSLAILLAGLFLSAQPLRAQSDDLTPPWVGTQEKIPPEVKDKEKEKPEAVCKTTSKDGLPETDVVYRNDKTGETTTVYYSQRKDANGKPKLVWKIKTEAPGKPTKTVTYDPEPGKETRTEKVGDKPETSKAYDPNKDYVAPKKQSMLDRPLDRLAVLPVAYRMSDASSLLPPSDGAENRQLAQDSSGAGVGTKGGAAVQDQGPSSYGTPVGGSANGFYGPGVEIGQPPEMPRTGTTDKSKTPKSETGEPSLNLKVVTFRTPHHETTIIIHRDDHPKQPQRPTETTHRDGGDGHIPEIPPPYWNPFKDPENPGVTEIPQKPGQGGGTTEIPGGGGGGTIEIGQGWAYTRIPDGCAQQTTDQTTDKTPTGGSTVDGGNNSTTDDPYKGFFGATRTKKKDCTELEKEMQYLLGMLEAICNSNHTHAKNALTAFGGDPNSKFAGGYAHWLQQAKVTQAVVRANNALGKTMIDVALFAVGGWGGLLGKESLAGKYLGTGISGAKDAADAWGKVAMKIVEKVGDEAAGYKAGKIGSAIGKTLDHPDEWYKGLGGVLESVIRGGIIDALGNWAEEGATSADLQRALNAYTEFTTNANLANLDAATYTKTMEKLKELMKQAELEGCPMPTIDKCPLHTFDLGKFGVGAFQGEKGPEMNRDSGDGSPTQHWDLFASHPGPGII